MTRPKSDRNLSLRERRARDRASTRELAREFKVSQPRVVQILRETGGDPLRLERPGIGGRRAPDLATASVVALEGEVDRLKERIGSDRRRLRVVRYELGIRRTDRLLGLN